MEPREESNCDAEKGSLYSGRYGAGVAQTEMRA